MGLLSEAVVMVLVVLSMVLGSSLNTLEWE